MRRRFSLFLLLGLLLALALPGRGVQASTPAPAASAGALRQALFNAQQWLGSDPAQAGEQLAAARAAYQGDLAVAFQTAAPEASQRIAAGFERAAAALSQGDAPAFAAARAQVWSGILAGSYRVVEKALQQGDAATARAWLPLREFRTTTRFSRPSVDATLAVESLAQGRIAPDDTLLALRADLLDTYQARLTETLHDLAAADANGFATRRAELAALAEGYFLILAPAYGQQRGADALAQAQAAFARLSAVAQHPGDLTAPLEAVDAALHNFRAAPLTPAEQARRAGQLRRFLGLVPVEYGRGVVGSQVTHDFEIQEAITFHAGAYAAFADLENLLDARDPQKTAQAQALFEDLGQRLDDAARGAAVATADSIEVQANALAGLLASIMPAEWLADGAQGDFEVIASMLDQMEAAVASGEYEAAESSRLEAYAFLETGPEARLMAFAPQLKLQLEDLFWNGQGQHKGLAYLIKNRAPAAEIRASRGALDAALHQAQSTLGGDTAPLSVAVNAGMILFREGLEAVIILASLMSSMKRPDERRYRKPMWLGAAAALAATILTWVLAHDVLQSLARYGEKLEAAVSLLAIAVLLVIMNWFFHKVYWTEWLAGFHARKRRILTGEAGLWLGLATLGFTSVYREGFETVLFLQALVLESGIPVVLSGMAAALLAVVLVGAATFRMQVNLPYKKMLIVTGVLIGGVLLQMVGNTTHILQIVGWMPIHVIEALPLPYWLGTWFGLYPTWEGISLQTLAFAFVIGSYYLAESLKGSHRPKPAHQTSQLYHPSPRD